MTGNAKEDLVVEMILAIPGGGVGGVIARGGIKIGGRIGSKVLKSLGKKGKGKSSSFGPNTVGAAEKYIPKNIKMVKDRYLKQKGIDAHELKGGFVGKKNMSHFDIYVDKDTGMLWIYRKGGKGEGVPTYEYIK